jgi:hypothetical protein
VLQDYRDLNEDQIELLEKQTLRTVVQALQQYSREAKHIFERTAAPTEAEVIVLAEDLTEYALEVAEWYPIDTRFAGFIDYKRVRWAPTPFGLIPQVLLVDAKASTENNRDTLQQSQLCMDADFASKGTAVHMQAGFAPHLSIPGHAETELVAVTTSVFVHFYYERTAYAADAYRRLLSIFALQIPHQRLKARYNPDSGTTFFGQGKHSPARGEVPRVRVYFQRLRAICPWRLQELKYGDEDYALPIWRDIAEDGSETEEPFLFIGR